MKKSYFFAFALALAIGGCWWMYTDWRQHDNDMLTLLDKKTLTEEEQVWVDSWYNNTDCSPSDAFAQKYRQRFHVDKK